MARDAGGGDTDRMLNVFDSSIATAVNHLIGLSPRIDAWVRMIAFSGLFKGAIMVATLWWPWFRDAEHDRDAVVASVMGATAGLFLARTLAHFLPYRDRPFHEPALHLPTCSQARCSAC